MKRLILALLALLALGWAGIVSGQTPITLAWDPGAPSAPGCVATATVPCYGPATDFAASYGTASGQYTVTQDLGLTCPGTPATATAPADPTACVGTVTLSPGTWFLAVEARDASVPSAYSNEIQTTVAPAPDPNCAAVTGADAISIFPTAVQQTGSGGPGSRFRLDFTALSPGSPITHLAIQSKGANISATDGTADGANVGNLAGLWATVPAASGAYPLSILATNTYGCTQVQATSYTVTIP